MYFPLLTLSNCSNKSVFSVVYWKGQGKWSEEGAYLGLPGLRIFWERKLLLRVFQLLIGTLFLFSTRLCIDIFLKLIFKFGVFVNQN